MTKFTVAQASKKQHSHNKKQHPSSNTGIHGTNEETYYGNAVSWKQHRQPMEFLTHVHESFDQSHSIHLELQSSSKSHLCNHFHKILEEINNSVSGLYAKM